MTGNGHALAPVSLAFVGAGPRTTGVLERIAANFAEVWPRGALRIDVVDPFPPGGGRVWRPDQAAHMLMNSRAADVTMFTDESIECAGPITPGPTLADWAAGYGGREISAPDLAAEARSLTPDSFPSRRFAGEYLRWCFRRALAALHEGVAVHDHRAAAVALTESADGRQRLALSDGSAVVADVVVLAQGNIDGSPDPEQRARAAFAGRHRGTYLPPSCTADIDLSGLPPGADVLVSGFGLAFVDLMSLLTEERGGRFVRQTGGELAYRPSGAEPVLWVGSRRGVPHLPKQGLALLGADPGPPRFATVEAFRAAGAAADLWSLTAKEFGWGYYQELFTAHPERTARSWPEFARSYEKLDWDSAALHALVEESVAPADRLDLEVLQRPLAGLRFASERELGAWMLPYVRATVDRVTLPGHSAWAGGARSLFTAGNQLAELLVSYGGELDPKATAAIERISEFNSFFSSGPPPFRLEQLLALFRAGTVRFLGAGTRVRTDESAGVFVASSGSLAVERRARHFVEARLAAPDVLGGGDLLLSAMVAGGQAQTRGVAYAQNVLRLVAQDGDYRVPDRSGRPHPRRYALGAFATGGSLGSFSVPGTNSPFFRQNDEVGRRLLRQLRALAQQRPAPAATVPRPSAEPAAKIGPAPGTSS
ncbi:FAD/NAD(P)-binding protein [Streptomyces ficellus]|uniref:FAD/NAD(P)-binding protein n=1 Tax=Streptomyces ficellus TaxID=1977088 RepID=A0ABT7Z3M9_9ACTN|nr:FAD/NAD(P)-binding protein [Streptomyces ficellus]MDN3294079.1 FAD/NAD(P)-binding protein [Streptomyces ficellus]